MRAWQFDAIGTKWWISVLEVLDDARLASIRRDVHKRIESFDKTYSRFRPDSLVTQMSQKAGTYRLPADSEALFALYRALYDATGGAVTPLIGDLLIAAGYDTEYSLKPKELRKPPAWDEAISYKSNVLTVKRPVMLDFGAAGKGYLVDLVAKVLARHGLTGFCIDAGGDMLVRGREDMHIGLEHPDNPKQVVGVATLADRAIAGSAGNRRAWAGYHHILDPFKLASPAAVKAAWVVADSALLADGLTTALFFVAPEVLRRQFTFEYLLINNKNEYKYSPGFPAELF
jgi:thiamine biosynthesis lipoprotein